jgi:RimJ/RimL family protein N-acetyltransferase
MIIIKNIKKEDVNEYWKLRLEALQDSPESFSASYEESVNQSIESVKERINQTEENYILGAFTESNHVVAMAGFRREQTLKLKHKGIIWGVYVAPEHRKQGIGCKLISEIIQRSKNLKDFYQINISTMVGNESARHLYKSLGFVSYGIERNALRVENKLLDEELMAYYIEG